MGTKIAGKYGRWFKEHGIQPEKKLCIECGWFAGYCLKWSKETNSFNTSCHFFQRKINPKQTQISIFKTRRYVSDYVYILDLLPKYKKKPIVQGVGEKTFTFVEMTAKEDIIPKIHDRVYIGNGYRPVISHVNRRIPYQELTTFGQSEFLKIVDNLILINEDRFVRFFNESNWITPKLHLIGLLAHINASKQERILREKDKKPFISFQDIEMRTGISPLIVVTNRILCELKNRVKYLLFIDQYEKDLEQKMNKKKNKDKKSRRWKFFDMKR